MRCDIIKNKQTWKDFGVWITFNPGEFAQAVQTDGNLGDKFLNFLFTFLKDKGHMKVDNDNSAGIFVYSTIRQDERAFLMVHQETDDTVDFRLIFWDLFSGFNDAMCSYTEKSKKREIEPIPVCIGFLGQAFEWWEDEIDYINEKCEKETDGINKYIREVGEYVEFKKVMDEFSKYLVPDTVTDDFHEEEQPEEFAFLMRNGSDALDFAQKYKALFQNGRLYSLGTGKTREFYILCNAIGDISMSLSETDYRPSVKSPAYIREHGTALSSLQELACL